MNHLVEVLRAWGPTGVLFLSILDSAGIPLVGGVDVLLVWFAVTNPAAAYSAAFMAILGSVIGSAILFYIARKGGEAYLKKYTSSKRGARLRHWFLEYGLLTIFVPALLPIPMPLKVFEISAGAMGVSMTAFLGVIVIARGARYLGLAYLGLHLKSNALPVLKHNLPLLLVIAVVLFFSLYLLIRLLDKRHKLEKLVTDSE